jgi:hypothetical protein
MRSEAHGYAAKLAIGGEANYSNAPLRHRPNGIKYSFHINTLRVSSNSLRPGSRDLLHHGSTVTDSFTTLVSE